MPRFFAGPLPGAALIGELSFVTGLSIFRNMTQTSRSLLWIPIILFLGLICRAALLEYTDLVDPTEARYASVAQEMVISGNWLTPMLPMPEGVVPYHGKPPLHFWLTATAYAFLGIDEWTARLPSFIVTLILITSIFLFTKSRFGIVEAWASTLIFFSSGMAFLLAGASVTDVTLTCMVTISTLALYLFASSPNASKYFFFASALFAGAGFLTKGPVSVVLAGLPVILWSLGTKQYAWIKRAPWITGIILFLAVIAPWFILSEIKNPGFLHYYLWNENIARFLFKDYGDRYGSGHVHMYGSSWLMLAGAFFPWTLVVGYFCFKFIKQETISGFLKNSDISFLLFWSICSPLFFSFVRQLHILYILPAIPPMSILTAVLFLQSNIRISRVTSFVLSRRFLGAFAFVSLILSGVGALLCFSATAVVLSAVVSLLGLILLSQVTLHEDRLTFLARSALALIAIYLNGLIITTPFIDESQSSEKMLVAIANSNSCPNRPENHQVGISTRNTFSHYWTSKAWINELPRQVDVRFIPPEEAVSSSICNYLVKASALKDVPKSVLAHFTLTHQSGDWLVYVRSS